MLAVARRTLMIAAAAAFLAACGQNGGGGGSAVTADDMSMGKADAKVTVIEYASVTCPHCAAWNAEVFPAFKAKYIDTGQVRYVFREFLTPPAEVAAAGFLIARCAGPDKYFGVIDSIFHSQNEMAQTGDYRGILFRIGQSAGMSNEQITTCISDEKQLEALQKRMETWTSREKVNATPTFAINGKQLTGEATLAQFDAAIQPLLK